MILVLFATKRFSSEKHGITLVTSAKALAGTFSALPTRMSNVSSKTLPILNLGWDTVISPGTERGPGVTQVCPCLRTGTAELRMTAVRAGTVFC